MTGRREARCGSIAANLFARAAHQCQYCGEAFAVDELSIDHVLPKSRGGRTQWDNVVSACVGCSTHKGAAEPRNNPIMAMKLNNPKYECWKAYLPAAGATVEFC